MERKQFIYDYYDVEVIFKESVAATSGVYGSDRGDGIRIEREAKPEYLYATIHDQGNFIWDMRTEDLDVEKFIKEIKARIDEGFFIE